jgi:hypothetical protein
MKKNKNGKYDVCNLSKGEWFEVDEEWLDGIKLDKAYEVNFRKEHGTNDVLEVIDQNGKSTYYDSKYGTWILNY